MGAALTPQTRPRQFQDDEPRACLASCGPGFDRDATDDHQPDCLTSTLVFWARTLTLTLLVPLVKALSGSLTRGR